MLKPSLPRHTIVEITWLDAESNPNWTSPDDIDQVEPPVVKTVGYYHGCKRKGDKVLWIILSHSRAGDRQADYTVIPFGAVIKMEKIGC
jgi:hypothetical protein